MRREEGWLLQAWARQELRAHAVERGIKLVQWRVRDVRGQAQWTTRPGDFDGILSPIAEVELAKVLNLREAADRHLPQSEPQGEAPPCARKMTPLAAVLMVRCPKCGTAPGLLCSKTTDGGPAVCAQREVEGRTWLSDPHGYKHAEAAPPLPGAELRGDARRVALCAACSPVSLTSSLAIGWATCIGCGEPTAKRDFAKNLVPRSASAAPTSTPPESAGPAAPALRVLCSRHGGMRVRRLDALPCELCGTYTEFRASAEPVPESAGPLPGGGAPFDARVEVDRLFDDVLLVAVDEIGRADASAVLQRVYNRGLADRDAVASRARLDVVAKAVSIVARIRERYEHSYDTVRRALDEAMDAISRLSSTTETPPGGGR